MSLRLSCIQIYSCLSDVYKYSFNDSSTIKNQLYKLSLALSYIGLQIWWRRSQARSTVDFMRLRVAPSGVFNRPGVAMTVLQAPLWLPNLLTHPFPSNFQKIITPDQLMMKFWEKVHLPQHITCHVSHVSCHASDVRCHVSGVSYQVSRVTFQVSNVRCHVSHIIFCFIFLDNLQFVELVG